MMTTNQTQQGFTLIELMIVVGIIAILAAIAYPTYSRYTQRANIENVRATMSDDIQYLERRYSQNRNFCGDGDNQAVASSPLTKCSSQPKLDSNINRNDKYTISITAGPSSYVLTATPNVYSNSVKNNSKVYVLYDSQTSTFTRCTKSGFTAAQSQGSIPDDACEVI